MTPKHDLVRREDLRWSELRELTGELTAEQAITDGYRPGWAIKDLLAHLACWNAQAATALEQIRVGTYTGFDRTEEEADEEWYQACRDLSLGACWAELHSARARLLEELDRLPEEHLTEGAPALEWFEGCAIRHPDDHLPRLREWLEELEIPV
jgi:hypothetical protein